MYYCLCHVWNFMQTCNVAFRCYWNCFMWNCKLKGRVTTAVLFYTRSEAEGSANFIAKMVNDNDDYDDHGAHGDAWTSLCIKPIQRSRWRHLANDKTLNLAMMRLIYNYILIGAKQRVQPRSQLGRRSGAPSPSEAILSALRSLRQHRVRCTRINFLSN